MSNAADVDARLLLALQKGLPIDARPFERVGTAFGLTGGEVLERVRAWFAAGVARRFGAVFDSRSLGYASTLCAAEVAADQLDASVARIVPHPGITHCYARDGHPNLWFTLTAPAGELDHEVARVGRALGAGEVLNLPALQKFKIEAVFGRDGDDDAPRNVTHPVAAMAPLPEHERRVVRRLQASVAVTEDPFGDVARETGFAPDALLELLGRWQATGVIRRIGLVVRHHKLGFSANSMCVWAAPREQIAAAGQALARSPHVTHCYERPSYPSFPYNLYAMIHAKSPPEAVEIFEKLGAAAGLAGGRMMWSVREFKKSSPVFFCEPPPVLAEPGRR